MFQTNPPDYDSVPDGQSSSREAHGKPDRLNKSNKEKRSVADPQFATLEAFASWLDLQLADLEATHEGFETVSSVRGFYGR